MSIKESPIRTVLSRQKEVRTKLLRDMLESLHGAIDGMERLADLYKKDANAAVLAGTRSQAEFEALAKAKLRCALELKGYAKIVEGELQATRSSRSLRQLGVPWKSPVRNKSFSSSDRREARTPRNLEWLHLLQSELGFSVDELAFLLETAYLAWYQQDADASPEALEKALNRFHERNPNIS